MLKVLLRSLLVLTIVLTSVSVAAYAQTNNSASTVTTFFIEGEPNVLDPQAASTIDEFQVLYNVYEGLVTYDPKTLDPKPLLADSWDVQR